MATEFKSKYGKDEDEQLQVPGASGLGAVDGASPNVARPATPSGRPNVQQYLDANKGAGEKLASGISNKLGQEADKINQGVQNSREKLDVGANPLEGKLGSEGQKFAQASFKDPKALLDAAKPPVPVPGAVSGGAGIAPDGVSGLANGQQGTPQPAAPNQFDANSLSEFQKLMSGGYGQNINSLGTQVSNRQHGLQDQYNKLAGKSNLAGSEAGRFELLRSTLGQPNYTGGQQKLDQLFLQSQPGVNRSLQQNLQGLNKQTGEGIQKYTSDSTARLNALQGLSSNRQDEISKMLSGGFEEGLESDISGRGFNDIKASNEARMAKANEAIKNLPGLKERLANNQLTAADIKELGLESGTQLYDAELQNYITQSEKTPTAAGVADPAEFARYRALQQLSGSGEADIFGGEQTAGGFTPYDYDKGALKSRIDERKNYHEVERPKQIASQLADIFRPAGTGSYSAGTTPIAQYGAHVFAPALRNATNLEEIRGILSNYENVAAQNGVPASYLYSKYPQFQELKNTIAQSDAQRGRSLQSSETQAANAAQEAQAAEQRAPAVAARQKEFETALAPYKGRSYGNSALDRVLKQLETVTNEDDARRVINEISAFGDPNFFVPGLTNFLNQPRAF